MNSDFSELSQEMIEAHKSQYGGQEKRFSEARILGRGNRPLSTGRVILEDGERLGAFWPQEECKGGLSAKNATTLALWDGRKFAILDFSGTDGQARCWKLRCVRIGDCQPCVNAILAQSRVITSNEATGFATFDSENIEGQIALILDRGRGRDKSPEYFRPASGDLIDDSGSGFLYYHSGDPIDIRPHLSLPPGRRGFRLVD